LQTDYPRPEIKTNLGDTVTGVLDEELTEIVNNLARKYNTSLFATLLSIFKVLLYRYTDNNQIVVGYPTAARNHSQLEDQIGFFVNTLALKTEINEGDNFTDILRQVNYKILE